MPELRLSDGAKLHYEDLGQGRPILLVHGFGMSGESFWPQNELKKLGRLIIPDLRGCANSSAGSKPLDIDTLGDDLFELINHLGLKDIIWIGWSMGAIVLWNAYGRHDLSKISKMIAIDMTAKVANEPDWAFGIKGLQSETTNAGKLRAQKVIGQMRDDWAGSVPRMVARIIASDARGSAKSNDIQSELEAIALKNNGTNAAALWRGLMDCDAREKVKSFPIKTTIIQGAKSQLYPPSVCAYMAKAIPNSELIFFENSGHAPHLEEAQRFNSIVAKEFNKPNLFEANASSISIS